MEEGGGQGEDMEEGGVRMKIIQNILLFSLFCVRQITAFKMSQAPIFRKYTEHFHLLLANVPKHENVRGKQAIVKNKQWRIIFHRYKPTQMTVRHITSEQNKFTGRYRDCS